MKNIDSNGNKKKENKTEKDIFYEFVNEFIAESDRAAVILGTAKLDFLLYQILTKYFIPVAGSSDDLLEGDSPLTTFSSKINICYRLGIIDTQFARTLHLIRKIRNSFAHEISGCNLDTGPHMDRIREMVAPFSKSEAFKDVQRAFVDKKTGIAADYFTILTLIVIKLESIFSKIEPLLQNEMSKLIPQKYTSIYKQEVISGELEQHHEDK
ncbi:MAG: hypothetical protein Q8N03_06580 [Ignavibacteria bacterium]|nr:hypothetical protein [Ignavibacteria bacterium]